MKKILSEKKIMSNTLLNIYVQLEFYIHTY